MNALARIPARRDRPGWRLQPGALTGEPIAHYTRLPNMLRRKYSPDSPLALDQGEAKRIHPISVCITAGNEEKMIRDCLESIRWCDEIILVDSESTDATREIAAEYTDKVFIEPWRGYIRSKQFAEKQATHEWILFLDADERVSPALRAEIERELSHEDVPCNGYEFPRIVFYVDRWIRRGDWYPDLKLRLYNSSFGKIAGQEPHDRIKVRGQVGRLKGPILHYTYANIHSQLDRANHFSSISARDMFEAGRKFRWLDLMFRPLHRFIRCYFFKLGFLEGMHGLIISVVSAHTTFVKYAKLWELHRVQGPKRAGKKLDIPPPPPPPRIT